MPISIKTNKSAEERKHSANNAYIKYFNKSNIVIDQIESNLNNNEVEKQKELESLFQQSCNKGNVGVELTLIEVIYNTSGEFYQVVNTENVGAAIQYYCLFFEGKVEINKSQFQFLTLDVSLDNKHNFMTKMMEDTL